MASHNILPYAGSYCWLFDQSATLFLEEMTDELYRHRSLSKAENNDGKCFYHFPSSCLESFSIDQCSTQQKVGVIRFDQDTLKLVTLVKYTDIAVLQSHTGLKLGGKKRKKKSRNALFVKFHCTYTGIQKAETSVLTSLLTCIFLMLPIQFG